MKTATEFLTALAQAVSTMTLYQEGHPSRERAVDQVHEKLRRLQEEDETATFTFLGGEVLYDGRPLRELKTWDWGPRLADVGVQRVELTGPVSRPDLEVFLEDVFTRLGEGHSSTAERRQTRPTNIRYGVVRLIEEEEDEEEGTAHRGLRTVTLDYNLQDEAEAIDWIHEELQRRGNLHLLEAEAIVRSLSVAMHGDQAFMIPLLHLKRYDQYTTTHALNVSVLAMGLAEFIGLGPREVRSFGVAGLLHDIGKTRIPDEILNKPGKLTDREREVMNSHTVEGARIIMEGEDFLDLAAVVAYEHHIKLDGGGYPELSYPRACHQASDLVHVCDVFDALRTDRPYRDAWPMEKVLGYLEEGGGSEFDPDLAGAFVQMMRRESTRVAEVEAEDDPLPLGEGEEEVGPGDGAGASGEDAATVPGAGGGEKEETEG